MKCYGAVKRDSDNLCFSTAQPVPICLLSEREGILGHSSRPKSGHWEEELAVETELTGSKWPMTRAVHGPASPGLAAITTPKRTSSGFMRRGSPSTHSQTALGKGF